jgi:nucleoside-diphosphate-sugar epimerase
MHRRVLLVTGGAGRIVWDRSQPNGLPGRCLDASRVERAFGFRGATPSEIDLRNMIDWYLSSPHSGETL